MPGTVLATLTFLQVLQHNKGLYCYSKQYVECSMSEKHKLAVFK